MRATMVDLRRTGIAGEPKLEAQPEQVSGADVEFCSHPAGY